MAVVGEADGQRNVRERLVRALDQGRANGYAPAHEVAMGRHAVALPEGPREVALREPGNLGLVGNFDPLRKLAFDMRESREHRSERRPTLCAHHPALPSRRGANNQGVSVLRISTKAPDHKIAATASTATVDSPASGPPTRTSAPQSTIR